MKKILSLLASIGIAATASTAVVACTSDSKQTTKKETPKKTINKELLKSLKEQKEKIEQLTNQVDVASAEYEAVNGEVNDISRKLSVGKDKETFLNKSTDEINKNLKATEFKINELAKRSADIVREKNKAIQDREQWVNKTIEDARNVIKINTEKIKSFDELPQTFYDELNSAKLALPIKEQELKQAKEALQNIDSERDKLIERLDEVSDAIDRVTNNPQPIKETQEEIWVLQEKMHGSDNEKEKQELQRQICKKQKDIENMRIIESTNFQNSLKYQDEFAKITKEISKSNKMAKTLRNDMYSLQNEVNEIKKTIRHHESLDGINEVLEKQKEENKRLIDNLDNEIRTSKKAIYDAQFNTNEYDGIIDKLSKEETNIEQQKNTLKEEFEVINNNLSSEDRALQIQHKIISDIEEKYNKVTNELKQKETVLENLKEQLDIAKATKQDIEDKLNK